MQKRLGSNVSCYSVCPGAVRTGIFHSLPWIVERVWLFLLFFTARSATEGAFTTLHCLLASESKLNKGGFHADTNIYSGSDLSRDENLAKKLWQTTEMQLKLVEK